MLLWLLQLWLHVLLGLHLLLRIHLLHLLLHVLHVRMLLRLPPLHLLHSLLRLLLHLLLRMQLLHLLMRLVQLHLLMLLLRLHLLMLLLRLHLLLMRVRLLLLHLLHEIRLKKRGRLPQKTRTRSGANNAAGLLRLQLLLRVFLWLHLLLWLRPRLQLLLRLRVFLWLHLRLWLHPQLLQPRFLWLQQNFLLLLRLHLLLLLLLQLLLLLLLLLLQLLLLLLQLLRLNQLLLLLLQLLLLLLSLLHEIRREQTSRMQPADAVGDHAICDAPGTAGLRQWYRQHAIADEDRPVNGNVNAITKRELLQPLLLWDLLGWRALLQRLLFMRGLLQPTRSRATCSPPMLLRLRDALLWPDCAQRVPLPRMLSLEVEEVSVPVALEELEAWLPSGRHPHHRVERILVLGPLHQRLLAVLVVAALEASDLVCRRNVADRGPSAAEFRGSRRPSSILIFIRSRSGGTSSTLLARYARCRALPIERHCSQARRKLRVVLSRLDYATILMEVLDAF